MTLAALAAAREKARALAETGRSRLRDLAGAFATLDRPIESCPQCGGPMNVQKTLIQGARTLELGPFTARLTVTVCAARCRHPSGQLVTRRAGDLVERLLPRGVVGYDVLVHIGLARFLRHRQREEIREELLQENISLSAGEVSHLTRRFLSYLRALHEDRSPALAAALREDGG